ncbi:hypothetical protein PHYC_02750 [Phycisphaerales bacterium]|nr:hypothetical protein PHYC_02750 [Phycisphaerales bacterium]
MVRSAGERDGGAKAAPPTLPAWATSRDEGEIREFLAVHAALCPYCRYPLHRLQAAKCPECGGALALGIVIPGHDPRGLRLFLPVLANVPIGLAGAVFATVVRGERDDWAVGVTIAAISGIVGLAMWLGRRRLARLPWMATLVVFVALCAAAVVLGGMAFFLDI